MSVDDTRSSKVKGMDLAKNSATRSVVHGDLVPDVIGSHAGSPLSSGNTVCLTGTV